MTTSGLSSVCTPHSMGIVREESKSILIRQSVALYLVRRDVGLDDLGRDDDSERVNDIVEGV